MMKPSEIKYILDNAGKKSSKEIAADLGLKERKVKRFIELTVSSKKEVHRQQSDKNLPDILNHFYFKLFAVLLISFLGIIVYSNTFGDSFHYDDRPSIIENSYIRNISNLQDIWNFLPRRFILYLSIAFNYHFNGLNTFGYHLFNLVVHLISSVLVWWLMLLTLSTPVMKGNKISQHANLFALLAGLIFVSHPIQTEAVTYIVQRTASMATLFYVASLCLYVKSKLSDGGKVYYAGSLLTAVLAMFTKETAITLPLIILLYEFSFLRTKKNINWWHVFPFFLTIFIIPLTIFLTESAKAQQMRGIVPEGPTNISSLHYLLTQFRVICTYVRLLFLPINQNLDYDYSISTNIFELSTLFSFLFLAGILYSAKRLFSNYRLISFSILWFFVTLLPESSFLPIKDVIFEHRLYLPMFGFCIFLVSCLYYLLEENAVRTITIALGILIVCNSVLTYQRNIVWKNDATLWTDTSQKSPHKARPYYNLGSAYDKQDNYLLAMSNYKKAIKMNPYYPEPYNNSGAINEKKDNFPQAMADFTKAIELNPKYAEAYNNRGVIYAKQDNISQAMADFTKAIELNPKYADAFNNRGNVYAKQNNTTQAMLNFSKAIELNPEYSDAYNNRGLIYAKQGNFSQAILDFSKVIKLAPNNAEAYNYRGSGYYKQGLFTQAIFDYNKAIELNPNYVGAYYNRAVTYCHLKEYDKSWGDVHKIEKLRTPISSIFINELKQASGQDK